MTRYHIVPSACLILVLVLALLPASASRAFDWGAAFSPQSPLVQAAAQGVINQAMGNRGWNGGGRGNRRCPQPAPYYPQQPVYRQPAPVRPVAKVVKETPKQKAERLFASAQKAFVRHDYASALKTMDEVVKLEPKSNSVLQFRSLVLFAQQDYQRAAADAYDALLQGPTWTWPTIVKLYDSDTDAYTAQYRALSRAAKEDDASLEKHFLLAYHHLMLGHLEHGQRELEKVLAIRPNEPVSAKLLEVVKNMRQAEAEKLANTR